MINEVCFACPWCGESNDFLIEPGERGQLVVVDCFVCCRPIEVRLPEDPESDQLDIRGEGQ